MWDLDSWKGNEGQIQIWGGNTGISENHSNVNKQSVLIS